MLQIGQHARLALEPSFDIRRLVVQYFDRDRFAACPIARLIDRAHAALTGKVLDFEAIREDRASRYHGDVFLKTTRSSACLPIRCL